MPEEEKSEAKETPEEKGSETQAETVDKQQEAEKSVDETMDKILDEAEGKEKPAESSSNSEEKPEEKEPEKEAKAGGEPDPEKKEAEATEDTDIPSEFHKHKAWIKLQDRAKAAEEKLAEQGGTMSEEDKALLENVKELTNSRQFLKDKYEREGFKEDVVTKKLADAGFKDAEEGTKTDLEIAAKALNLNVEDLSEEAKADITSLAKISRAMMSEDLNRILPAILNPISEKVAGLTGRDEGIKIHEDFVDKVGKDGLLNYEKDLAPDISKFLDDNPEATQQDVAKFQQDTYHSKLVLYQNAVKNKDERDNKVEGNRPGGEGSAVKTGLPDKTGDFEKDANAFLDHAGVT